MGTRLGVVNQQGRQAALDDAIAANVKPHVRDALTPLFRGTRPVQWLRIDIPRPGADDGD